MANNSNSNNHIGNLTHNARPHHPKLRVEFGQNVPYCVLDADTRGVAPELHIINDVETLDEFCRTRGGKMYYQSRSGLSGAGWVPRSDSSLTPLRPYWPNRPGKNYLGNLPEPGLVTEFLLPLDDRGGEHVPFASRWNGELNILEPVIMGISREPYPAILTTPREWTRIETETGINGFSVEIPAWNFTQDKMGMAAEKRFYVSPSLGDLSGSREMKVLPLRWAEHTDPWIHNRVHGVGDCIIPEKMQESRSYFERYFGVMFFHGKEWSAGVVYPGAPDLISRVYPVYDEEEDVIRPFWEEVVPGCIHISEYCFYQDGTIWADVEGYDDSIPPSPDLSEERDNRPKYRATLDEESPLRKRIRAYTPEILAAVQTAMDEVKEGNLTQDDFPARLGELLEEIDTSAP
jgi:hypothetical protein